MGIEKALLISIVVPAGSTAVTYNWGNQDLLRGKQITSIQAINSNVPVSPDGSANLNAAAFAKGFLNLVYAKGTRQDVMQYPLRYLDPQLNFGVIILFNKVVVVPSKCTVQFGNNTSFAALVDEEILLLIGYIDPNPNEA